MNMRSGKHAVVKKKSHGCPTHLETYYVASMVNPDGSVDSTPD